MSTNKVETFIYDDKNRLVYHECDPYIACILKYDQDDNLIEYKDTYGLKYEYDYGVCEFKESREYNMEEFYGYFVS